MPADPFPKIIFAVPFDERAQFEAKARGYLSHAKVQQGDGKLYPVVFYDTARLSQDLEYEVSSGRMCIAEVGLIVLPEVTFENIIAAVRRLTEEGFFSGLRPVSDV